MSTASTITKTPSGIKNERSTPNPKERTAMLKHFKRLLLHIMYPPNLAVDRPCFQYMHTGSENEPNLMLKIN